MPILVTLLKVILLIAVVLTIFNVIIFVHELGHFLAAKWRGLRIDRFQIWFGKPIWKKDIGGVQYGLGWIPAGGFVALPQMAPMEALEGANHDDKPLPAISPLDKIIVAFAGPLFSLLLALAAACVVWGVGKPADFIPTQSIGYVKKDSPAEKAGIHKGDKILTINGKAVNGFAGSLDSIQESIILSKGSELNITVQRPGETEPVKVVSKFETADTKWYQRGGLREIGIAPESDHIVIDSIYPNSPAAKAGFKDDDILVSANGKVFKEVDEVVDYIQQVGAKPIDFEIKRDKKLIKLTATPQVPIHSPDDNKKPMLGIQFWGMPFQNEAIVHPLPFKQVGDSLRMMWTTVNRVVAPDSSIGVGHLSGPVGIGTVIYQFLQMEEGWRLVLSVMVLFNVNLAVLNMMPFPVLDGGHITLAILEKIMGRPVKAKPLEILQTVCALALISLMLFVTSKDIGDRLPRGGDKKENEVVFPD